MAITALTGVSVEEYTPEAEREEESPATFTLRPLDGENWVKVMSHYNPDTQRITGDGIYQAARLGLEGWNNVNDHRGKPLKFSSLNIRKLPGDLVIELGQRVIEISDQSGDQEKNS